MLVRAMKAYRGLEIYLHSFLISARGGGEWLNPRLGRFTPVPVEKEVGCCSRRLRIRNLLRLRGIKPRTG